LNFIQLFAGGQGAQDAAGQVSTTFHPASFRFLFPTNLFLCDSDLHWIQRKIIPFSKSVCNSIKV